MLVAWVPGPFVALLGAISIGFWVAYLQLFIHEGAHFNFSPDRERSDLLCNILISWMVGTSVQQYRIVHFQHHRALGRVDDSEMSYFFPLNIRFLAKGLFGVRVIEVLLVRRSVSSGSSRSSKNGLAVGLVGVGVHGAIVVGSFLFGYPWVGIAWVAGIVMIFPALGALRQLLEHRDVSADPKIDYRDHDHGAYTRMFGTDVFSSLFGGAGFNRHLLHHWEPQVSYTNLPELEAYLLDTDVARLIEMRRSSYVRTFISLFRFS